MSQVASAPAMCSWSTEPSCRVPHPRPSYLVRSGLLFSLA